MNYDRLFLAIRGFVDRELSRFAFLCAYDYTVVGATGNTVDVVPVTPSTKLPSMTRVPLRSSLLGQSVAASVGGSAVVRFVNGDPARPIVTSLSGPPSAVTVDAVSELDVGPSAVTVTFAGGTLGLAAVGDGASLYFPPGCFVSGTLTAPGGATTPVTSIAILNGIGAMISEGSPNVVTA